MLYIGVTNDLYRRLIEHKNEAVPGFTQKYKCHYLVYYEMFTNIEEAIAREKALKGWKRDKKETLVKSLNPLLKDLAEDLGWT